MATFTPPPIDDRPLKERVETIWKRNLHNLPVYKDFPRLAGGFEIINGNNKQIIFKEDSSSSRAQACKQIISTLALFFPDTITMLSPKRRRADSESSEKNFGEPLEKELKERFDVDEQTLPEDCDDDDDDAFLTARDREHEKDEDEIVEKVEIKPNREKELLPKSISYSTQTSLQPGESFADMIVVQYCNHVKDNNGDLAVQMNNFLKCGTFDENGKLACVLKCVQQEIICPAVMDLRLGVYPKFPYKDIKGTWYVRVEIFFEPKFKKRGRSSSKNHEQIQTNTTIVQSSPKTTRKRRKSLKGSKAKKKSRTLTDEPSPSSTSPHSQNPLRRLSHQPDSWLQRTNSLPSFDIKVRRSRSGDKEKTSSPTAFRSNEMESLRSSVHQVIGISVSDSDEEGEKENSTCDYDEGSLLRLASESTIKKVRVIHRKRERSNVPNVVQDTNNPDFLCEFEWELAMTFDADMKILQDATLQIVDVATPDNISRERNEDLLNAIAPYTSREFPYVVIWKSPATKSYLHKELLHLSTICEILDNNGSKLYEPSSSKAGLSSMLLCLSLKVKEKSVDDSSALSPRIVALSDHKSSKTLKQFISGLRDNIEGERRLLSILKAASPEMQTPTISHFRQILGKYAKTIKAVKGSRRVVLLFSEHEITVSQYLRMTCPLSTSSEKVYTFAAVDHLAFSESMKHLDSVKTEITEHSFSPKVPESRKTKIKGLLKDYVTKNTIETTTTSLPVSVAINCLATALQQLPVSEQVVNDPELPGGRMSSLNLLDLLLQVLPEDIPPITFTELKQGTPSK